MLTGKTESAVSRTDRSQSRRGHTEDTQVRRPRPPYHSGDIRQYTYSESVQEDAQTGSSYDRLLVDPLSNRVSLDAYCIGGNTSGIREVSLRDGDIELVRGDGETPSCHTRGITTDDEICINCLVCELCGTIRNGMWNIELRCKLGDERSRLWWVCREFEFSVQNTIGSPYRLFVVNRILDDLCKSAWLSETAKCSIDTRRCN